MITKEMVAMQLQEAVDKLTEITNYAELKYHAADDFYRRSAYWYGYAETIGPKYPESLQIEADATELSVVLHGLIREIEQGGPHANKNGYAYLKF